VGKGRARVAVMSLWITGNATAVSVPRAQWFAFVKGAGGYPRIGAPFCTQSCDQSILSFSEQSRTTSRAVIASSPASTLPSLFHASPTVAKRRRVVSGSRLRDLQRQRAPVGHACLAALCTHKILVGQP